jgi:BirA family transcriptional regulator, biotin operon repressor / biotin---[acetyl-CoA-carboxylase] ligase
MLRWDDIRRSIPLGGIEAHEVIASTNDRALELAADGHLALPFLVAAERQTAGRGRGANRWWSSPGSLAFSVVVESPTSEVDPARRPRIALVAGLAVCEAIETLLPGCEVRVKWPNDVYVAGRKVCGILVESRPPRVVVGIGINVNNAAAEAPAELRGTVISLRDAGGRAFDRTDVLTGVLRRLCASLGEFERGEDDLLSRWAPRCFLTGRIVRIESGGRATDGRCRGIDEEGALMLDTEAGLSRHVAGAVTFE